MNLDKIVINSLIGQAVGDAMGVPVEFLSRDDVRTLNLHDMIGCDVPHDFKSHWSEIIPAGAWSDDTSLTVAAMSAIIFTCGKIDYDQIMEDFLDWWQFGMYASTDSAFGLGSTCSKALKNFVNGFPALDCGMGGFEDNGNGSLMRILPFSLYCIAKDYKLARVVDIIDDASSITHAHQISRMGCLIFTIFLKGILYSGSVADAWENARKIDYSAFYKDKALEAYKLLLSDEFLTADDSCIGQTGYVVDTLMTAVYSMIHTNNYRDAVLTAINMGFDTDTAGAVTGALAGVLYGRGNIPRRWRAKLLQGDLLAATALDFADVLLGEK